MIPSSATSTRTAQLSNIESIGKDLPHEALAMLAEFAQFLKAKHPSIQTEVQALNPIDRPVEENVIAAIRRLSKTYPMLDKSILFEQTSAAMSAHVLQEISSTESIDRLEQVFKKEYEAYLEQGTAR